MKLTAMIKFKNDELKDIPSFLHQHNKRIQKSYNDVLELALEQYLGRRFVPERDAHMIFANEYEGTNQTDYYIDDKLIGTLSTVMDYNGDDFPTNRISLRVQFLPAILTPTI